MAQAEDQPGMVPVERAELVTPHLDVFADLIRQTYTEHEPSFRCPARVEASLRAATVSGLHARR